MRMPVCVLKSIKWWLMVDMLDASIDFVCTYILFCTILDITTLGCCQWYMDGTGYIHLFKRRIR